MRMPELLFLLVTSCLAAQAAFSASHLTIDSSLPVAGSPTYLTSTQ